MGLCGLKLIVYNRVPTHLENLDYSWKFINLENSWIFMSDVEFMLVLTL